MWEVICLTFMGVTHRLSESIQQDLSAKAVLTVELK